MDTTLWSYRLKTARQKKRLQKKDLDKQLLRMERELNRLEEIKSNQPVVPLEKPYQKGWIRKFVLRSEVEKSDKAAFYQEILDKINSYQHHYDQSFKQPKRNKHRHRYNYTKLPVLRTISTYYNDAIGVTKTPNQRDCEVVFWINKDNAPYVITKPLHHTQKLLTEDETGKIFSIRVILNFELERELLGFGSKMRVLGPRILVKQIKEQLRKAQENYEVKGLEVEEDVGQ